MASNTIKNDTKDKFKNLFGINLENYSSKFLAHTKKHLGHTVTPTNVQNNCMKLSGFGVDITKLFLHREVTRNILRRERFFNPKTLSQVFRTNFTYTYNVTGPLSLPGFFGLSKTGNKVFSKETEIY